MEVGPFPSARRAAHDLTKAEPFALGPLIVDPPARRLGTGVRSETLEPRVMQVLVALGSAGGRVLSRDDLIERCWDGTVVGDNAINRVIFRLRHALEELGEGAVRLETIPRVGFRLVVNGQAAGAAPLSNPLSGAAGPVPAPIAQENMPVGRRRWSRRATALGLFAAGGAAMIGTAGWLWTKRHVPDPRAVELYRRAQQIQKDGDNDLMGEAIKAYKQAVAIDPHYADAWGALALSYRYSFGGSVQLGDPKEVRAAAARALELDPANADARLALILVYPFYRHWQEREARLRALLRDHPDSALGHVWLGWLMLETGRIEDAVTVAQQAIDIDPAPKSVWFLRAFAYYFAGRDGPGDVTMEELRSRWPQDTVIYAVGYFWLLGGRRYNEARAYAADTGRRPRVIRPEIAESWVRKADALATGRGMAEFQNKPRPATMLMQGVPYSVVDLAVFGKVDELFALLEAYFFGGEFNGTRFPPPGPLDRRYSFELFYPVLAGLRGDPRYASLLARTGLEDYWRKSGIQPDFRRG